MKVSKAIEEEQKNGITASLAQEREMLKSKPLPKPGTVNIPANSAEIHVCPECGGPVEHEGGCVICRNCGFSKCG